MDSAPSIHQALLHHRTNIPLTFPFKETIGFLGDVFFLVKLIRQIGQRSGIYTRRFYSSSSISSHTHVPAIVLVASLMLGYSLIKLVGVAGNAPA